VIGTQISLYPIVLMNIFKTELVLKFRWFKTSYNI